MIINILTITITLIQKISAHGADLTGTVFMMVAAQQNPTIRALPGSPIIFFIAKSDPGNIVRAISECSAGTALHCGQFFFAKTTYLLHAFTS